MSGRSGGGSGRRGYGGSSEVRVKKRDGPMDDERSGGGGSGDGKSKGGDEVRISKLTRLLARLDTEESFFTICGQIESALKEEENQRYVSRCFQCLCPSFQDVFKGLPGLSWEVAGSKRFAQLLSLICLSMETQTVKFFQWLVDVIIRSARSSQTSVSSTVHLAEFVSAQIMLSVDTPDVIIFIKCIYDVLEEVSNPKVFRALGGIFVFGTNHTAATWRNPHFHDFIDMVVGWMVDVQQSNGQYTSCTELLENARPQFLIDMGFLVTLMSQLLEDLEKVIKKVQPTSEAESEEFCKILQFIRAFTTLLSLECPVEKSVLTDFSDRLVASTLQFIRMCEPHQNMDHRYRYKLLTTVNKALFFSGGILSQSITKYFRAQLKLGTANSTFTRWPKPFLNGFLKSITVWVETAVSQTQLSEDIIEISDVLIDLIEDMRKALPPHDQHYVMNLLVALLRTRNVNLLQKTYGWLIAKLPPSEKQQSESVEDDEDVMFVLMGLTDLIGNKGSAIFSLWALQPAIFEILIEISNRKIHSRTRQCSLELLKTHCNMHSHFISSVASTGSFNTESPGTRFLPALMDFWVEKLQELEDSQDVWLLEWIYGFLQNTNSYATPLYEVKADFFERLLNIIFRKRSLILVGADIMKWFCCDSDYIKLDQMKLMLQERLVFIILNEKLPDRVKIRYKSVLYNMQQLIVVPDVVFFEDCVELDVSFETEPDKDSSHALIFTEFNFFLYELLVGNSINIPKFAFTTETADTKSNKLLSVAADHLIRMKLKTPIGKPQDFFAQLLLVFKRSRAARIPVPTWKLHFVFELEKKFQFWTHGSAVDDTELTEHVKQFYTMNKTPFLEWLKKIRLEIIESCMLSQEYSLAYFNAALMGDTSRMEYALYQTNDLYGLKGMGCNVASSYLEGKFEEALTLLKKVDAGLANPLNDQIRLDLQQILQDSCTQLQRWSDPALAQSEEIVPNSMKLKGLVEFQLASHKKVDISFMSSPSLLKYLKLPVVQKLHCWLVQLPTESVSEEQMQYLERIKFEKMLDAGNVDYVKNWLVKNDLDVNSITSDEDLSNLSLASVPVDTLKICADFYTRKLEWTKSAVLYNALRELVTGSIDCNLAVSVTESLVSRIVESDEFFQVFSRESLNQSTKSETISSLHQVAVHSFPETSRAWLIYGDYAYSQSGKRSSANLSQIEIETLKSTTVQCYAKYVQLLQSEDGTKTSYLDAYSPKNVVMARLLQLFKEGYKFDFEETVNSEDWLILIAEIAQIPEMREFIVEKYPNQAALFFTSYDSERVQNKLTVRRRNLFDLSPYSYVDTSEEPLNSSILLSNLSHLEKLCSATKEPEKTNQFEFHFRSSLKIPSCATLFTKELLHVASSMEDMWVWSLERIAVDWTRRISYLRKECNRSLSSDKIQTFIQPIITYLNELVSATQESQSMVDMNFLNRHKAGIQNYLDQLSASRSLEEVALAMNSLLKYSERFGIVANNKLPLNLFSTKLADQTFYESPDFSICLPGQPSHIKISNIFHIIHALPTKTKPKRIRVLATNGKYYDYLVKGTENLNIDCGVMQFLKVSQSFFKFPTRTYSVTPLGKRGGLIQIVPDAIPLFALYKKHLQRNNCLEKTSEMFWRRMNSLGYDDRSSIAAQREVYESLCSETSCDLITRELLLSAQTPSQWLDSLQTFTRDCSIGSAIGYLLGIGDRHLDNMLVNITHGKFIHVDFSIIFGKGASLRIPEKVPFRLTQNLSSVLQHPGPLGSFYHIMQDVLKAFQEYRDTAVHLVKNIAFCHLYDEDAPVDLSKVLASEAESAVKLFICRASQYLSLLQPLRNDVLEAAGDLDSVRQLGRKINRWRRMLVNLNTVLQFAIGATHADIAFKDALEIVHRRWIPMFQLSLEMGMDPQTQSCEKFLELLDTTEKLLVELQASFSDLGKIKEMGTLKLQDANAQVIDMDRVEILVKYAEMNIQTYSPNSSVKKLIEEATNVDNLAQMYEGWTPWV